MLHPSILIKVETVGQWRFDKCVPAMFKEELTTEYASAIFALQASGRPLFRVPVINKGQSDRGETDARGIQTFYMCSQGRTWKVPGCWEPAGLTVVRDMVAPWQRLQVDSLIQGVDGGYGWDSEDRKGSRRPRQGQVRKVEHNSGPRLGWREKTLHFISLGPDPRMPGRCSKVEWKYLGTLL